MALEVRFLTRHVIKFHCLLFIVTKSQSVCQLERCHCYILPIIHIKIHLSALIRTCPHESANKICQKNRSKRLRKKENPMPRKKIHVLSVILFFFSCPRCPQKIRNPCRFILTHTCDRISCVLFYSSVLAAILLKIFANLMPCMSSFSRLFASLSIFAYFCDPNLALVRTQRRYAPSPI